MYLDSFQIDFTNLSTSNIGLIGGFVGMMIYRAKTIPTLMEHKTTKFDKIVMSEDSGNSTIPDETTTIEICEGAFKNYVDKTR